MKGTEFEIPCFIDEKVIESTLKKHAIPTEESVKSILKKAELLKGLTLEDVAILLNIDSQKQKEQLYNTAKKIKSEIYGNRLVLFAPLYVSNHCANNCLYCGFRRDNTTMHRTCLTIEEIKQQTKQILSQGHKRILMLMGEDEQACSFKYFLECIDAAYSVKDEKSSSIRRINVEIAPLTDKEFHKLSKKKIGTYTVFQETYHQQTYKKMHPVGKKSDYLWRLTVMDRALKNGLHDVGIGALFGLYDYKFEVLALLAHAKHLDKTYNVGPHTISIPRIEPADNAPCATNIPCPVNDEDFKKIVAILRCAVPYTGIILSTRESAKLRTQLFDLGVSQISAGSKTAPGGYSTTENHEQQFTVNDNRTTDEIIQSVIKQGYVPSFCTGCYRLGRIGKDFMDIAKPGLIKLHCLPNALTTLKEYLVDYAEPETKKIGEVLIKNQLNEIPDEKRKEKTKQHLKDIEHGKRDLYF